MEKILFNGRPASQMILNGDVIWTAIDLSHHVYYSIDNSSTTDTLTTQVDGKYIYLPNMDTEFSAIQVSIIGQTNTKVVDLEGAANILVSDVDQLRVYFPKNTTYVKFNGGSHRIKKLLHCDTGNLTDMESMFSGCTYLEYVTLLGWDTSNVRYISRLFNGCKNLKSITDLENLNFSGLTADEWGDEMGIWAMFNNCTSLTSLDLSSWDTSNVKYMVSTFYNCSSLTSLNLSGWDTSKVTSMDNLFSGCSSLATLDISHFITNNVTGMHYMFSDCSSLATLNMSLNTSNVTGINGIFNNCSLLTSLDLTSWDVSNVEYMGQMFSGCTGLTFLDLSTWDTSNVESMSNMFLNVSTSIDWNYEEGKYENFTLSEAQTGYAGMFPWNKYYIEYTVTSNSYALNRGSSSLPRIYSYSSSGGYNYDKVEITLINGTVTSNLATNCNLISKVRLYYPIDTYAIKFYSSSSYTPEIATVTHIKTNNLTDMSYMFNNCFALTSLDLSNFDTSKVTDMRNMFYNCRSLTSLDLSNFDTSKVTSMYQMFSECRSLTSLDVSNFDTSKVTNMSYMFHNCISLTSLDVSNFDTNKVTNMSYMFFSCSKLTSLDVSNFNTSIVTAMKEMFYECSSLTSLDLSNFDTNKVTSSSNMLWDVPSTVDWNYDIDDSINYQNFTLTESQTSFSGAFPWNLYILYTISPSTAYTISEKGIPSLYRGSTYSSYDKIEIRDTSGNIMVSNDLEVPLSDVGSIKIWYSSDITKISFNNVRIKTLDSIKTDYLNDMKGMFSNCTLLESINTSGWNTSNVTNMSQMFYYCSKLTSLDLSSFNTIKVENMSLMFYYCNKLTSLDVSNFNTRNVTDMNRMFYYCSSLTSLDVSSFNTSIVSTMNSMFGYCSSLTSLNLSNFNTSFVTDMCYMFSNCTSLKYLNISNFNTGRIVMDEDYGYMADDIFNKVPSSVFWYYDGSNYLNCDSFSNYYSSTGFSGTFPWTRANKGKYTTIDYSTSTKLPTYPSWFSRYDSNTNSFKPAYINSTYYGLWSGQKNVDDAIYRAIFKIVAPDNMSLKIGTRYNTESGYDIFSIHANTVGTFGYDGENQESYTTNLLVASGDSWSSVAYSDPFFMTAGATYYICFLYSKDGSGNSTIDGALIQTLDFYYT